jgi:hypothetical protein
LLLALGLALVGRWGGAVMVTVRARDGSRRRFGVGAVTAAATTADGVRVLVWGDGRHGDEFLAAPHTNQTNSNQAK